MTERWTIEGSNFSADRLTRVSGPELAPRAQARVVLEADYNAAIAALRKIRDQAGAVCAAYETCEHATCQASYTAWALADEALT